MRNHYIVEVGLQGNSLRIEANDQAEAIRLAKDVVLEDGLLIFAQRMDKGEHAEDEGPERTSVIWRPGHEWSDQKNMKRTGMSLAMGSDRYGHCADENRMR
jgi:hypothetical protein